MDAINRGGSYSMRVRMLAPFADARKCANLAGAPSFAEGLLFCSAKSGHLHACVGASQAHASGCGVACRRISPLEAFAGRNDIADPLYGNAGGAGEAAALHETLRHLRIACAGLINYLEGLNSRCVTPHDTCHSGHTNAASAVVTR
jgi:hypothetical protein